MLNHHEIIEWMSSQTKQFDSNPFFSSYLTYSPAVANKAVNEFIVLLKPETLDGLEPISNLLLEKVTEWKFEIRGITAISGEYLRKHHQFKKNYHTLNQVAHNGLKAAPEHIQTAVQKDQEAVQATLLHGYKALRALNLSPSQLNQIYAQGHHKKYAAGVYSSLVSHEGKPYLILNGFHPHQLECLTRADRGIFAFALAGSDSWKELRDGFLGGIQPSQAKLGSLRRTIHDNKGTWKLPEVSIDFNYLHISPGPVEAMYQTAIFMHDPAAAEPFALQSTNLGKLLQEHLNFKEKDLSILTCNPTLKKAGAFTSLFDISEDSDTKDIITILGDLMPHANQGKASSTGCPT